MIVNQELAFDKLSKLKVGALFMEMGTGKTKVALDLIASKKDKVNYILWICPFSTKKDVKKEFAKWHPELQIEIIGCETISSSKTTFIHLFNEISIHKSFIVVDESLKIKNVDAKRTQRINRLGEFAKYKLILNGTPLSKNVLDLYTQMNFLSPKILNMPYCQFKNQYCEYYIRGRLKNKVKKQYNIEHLISLISPYIFDCELDLAKTKHYYSYEYEIENKDEYDNTKMNYLKYGDEFNFYCFATILQKIYVKSKGKNEILSTILSNIKEQVIIFVKFLSSIPEKAHRISGDINLNDREQTIQDFKDGKFKELYITYGCGSFGLNLQFCHNVIFIEHTFDYAVRLQAEARIYRIGQKDDVNYYDIKCNCGLEKLIIGCLNKKNILLDEVKNNIEKVGVEKWLKDM